MLDGPESSPAEQSEGRATRAVACVDVRMAGEQATSGGDPQRMVIGFALRQIEQAVRAGDRICPLAVSRLVVEFAPLASRVPPQVLGDRLARAIGHNMPFDSASTDLAVSVGMAAPGPRLGSADLARRALSAARAGRAHLGTRPAAGAHRSDTIVTVDRLVTPGSASGPSFEPIHRRTVYRYESGRIRGIPTILPSPYEVSDRPDPEFDGASTDLTVLIADPMASAIGYPGLAAMTAASMAERLGCRTASEAASLDEPLTLAIDGIPVDLVVLVLDGGWLGQIPTWSSSAWGVPARLTASYQAAGIPVVAVSAGAGAGAVASCVAQGALAIFHLDQLPSALRALRNDPEHEMAQLFDLQVPARFRSLVALTASERRILFYLTEGWAAQDIADELVVSLTTVRSHIRSVLRKLGVRSQLAAVAIANSRDLERDNAGQAS